MDTRAGLSGAKGESRWSIADWSNRLIASRKFQSWAAHFPLTRRMARKDGEKLFDLVSGFVYSQVLLALVELDIFEDLRDGPKSLRALSAKAGIEDQRMRILLRAGVSLELLKERRTDQFALARLGAALLGVPGLPAMIQHHGAFYRDLGDPVALLRGDVKTELAQFWPYVFGASGDVPRDVYRRYSDLMADSQSLVAEDTLRAVSFAGVRHLVDIGGGSGAFLTAVGGAYDAMSLELFDLPGVAPQAESRFAKAGLSARAAITPGSFRDDTLPQGADCMTLIRVLYDHEDATVQALLSKVFNALPKGGRLVISEPMTGAKQPKKAGDAYFAFYTLAMRTGRARSAGEIAALCEAAGFSNVTIPRVHRPFVTSVVCAVKPD